MRHMLSEIDIKVELLLVSVESFESLDKAVLRIVDRTEVRLREVNNNLHSKKDQAKM